MLISNSKRFVFVHITKAAGTSVTCALANALAWNDVMLGGTRYGEKFEVLYGSQFPLQKHSSAREIKAVVGDEVWSSYFKFSFVRHPYARAVSLYTFIEMMLRRNCLRPYLRFVPVGAIRERITGWQPTKLMFDSAMRHPWLKRYLGRRHWRRDSNSIWGWPLTKAYLETDNFSAFIRHEYFDFDQGAQPQMDWLTDTDGRMIVDFVGKVENMQEDLAQICTKIGAPVASLDVRNRSDRNGNLNHYLANDDDRRYLHEKYRQDFDAFGYDATVPPIRSSVRSPLAVTKASGVEAALPG